MTEVSLVEIIKYCMTDVFELKNAILFTISKKAGIYFVSRILICISLF